MRSHLQFLAVVLLLLIGTTSIASAETNVFDISLRQWANAGATAPGSFASVDRRLISLAWQPASKEKLAGLSYHHEPVLVRPDDSVAHNGYFHRLDARLRAGSGNFTVLVEAGVHASSNMFKHTRFRKDALVATLYAEYRVASDWQVGLYGDYRFDGFHLYPGLSTSLAAGRGQLTVNLPTAIEWAAGNWWLGIHRYGQKWAALDDTLAVESKYYLDEWQAAIAYRLNDTVELAAGITFDTAVRYRDLSSGDTTAVLDDNVFLQLRATF